MTAPAPIAAAIEEARKAVEKYDYCYPPAYWDEGRTPKCYADHATDALRSLLLALETDPWLTQYQEAKSDADDRLAKAEAVLSRCASAAGNCHPADGCRSVLAIHRDYFAEKGDDRG